MDVVEDIIAVHVLRQEAEEGNGSLVNGRAEGAGGRVLRDKGRLGAAGVGLGAADVLEAALWNRNRNFLTSGTGTGTITC